MVQAEQIAVDLSENAETSSDNVVPPPVAEEASENDNIQEAPGDNPQAPQPQEGSYGNNEIKIPDSAVCFC